MSEPQAQLEAAMEAALHQKVMEKYTQMIARAFAGSDITLAVLIQQGTVTVSKDEILAASEILRAFEDGEVAVEIAVAFDGEKIEVTYKGAQELTPEEKADVEAARVAAEKAAQPVGGVYL